MKRICFLRPQLLNSSTVFHTLVGEWLLQWQWQCSNVTTMPLQAPVELRNPETWESSSHRLKRQRAAETAESTYFLCCCSRILFLLLLQSDSKLLLLFHLFPLLLHRLLSKLTEFKVLHEKGSSDLNSSEASKLPISHNSMIESK